MAELVELARVWWEGERSNGGGGWSNLSGMDEVGDIQFYRDSFVPAKSAAGVYQPGLIVDISVPTRVPDWREVAEPDSCLGCQPPSQP